MTVTDTSILLTGPTRGLGRAALTPLARRRSAHLVLVGRGATALAEAARTARRGGAREVTVVEADLADLDSVVAAGAAITGLVASGAPPLGAQVLNAGLQRTDDRSTSAQGHELTFAVNVLAQHALLRGTTGAMVDGGHVVVLGSGVHYGDWRSLGLVPAPVWRDPLELARPGTGPQDKASGGRAYADSKLAVLHLARAWQARQERLRVNVYDPGLLPGTGLARERSGAVLWAWNSAMPALTALPGWSTPERSAEHLTRLALGEGSADLRGGYVAGGRVRRSSPASYDLGARDRLGQVCEELVVRTGDVVYVGHAARRLIGGRPPRAEWPRRVL